MQPSADVPASVIVVSHDRRLLARVDRIVEMGPGGLKEYGGDFEFYREQRNLERAAAEQALAGAEQRLERARASAQRTREHSCPVKRSPSAVHPQRALELV